MLWFNPNFNVSIYWNDFSSYFSWLVDMACVNCNVHCGCALAGKCLWVSSWGRERISSLCFSGILVDSRDETTWLSWRTARSLMKMKPQPFLLMDTCLDLLKDPAVVLARKNIVLLFCRECSKVIILWLINSVSGPFSYRIFWKLGHYGCWWSRMVLLKGQRSGLLRPAMTLTCFWMRREWWGLLIEQKSFLSLIIRIKYNTVDKYIYSSGQNWCPIWMTPHVWLNHQNMTNVLFFNTLNMSENTNKTLNYLRKWFCRFFYFTICIEKQKACIDYTIISY